MQGRNNRAAYAPPPFIQEALAALKPPPTLTASQSAEKYRILDSKSSAAPGRWRNDVTPYLREVMDFLNAPDLTECTLVKPTQVGGTEALLNMILYCVIHNPGPMLVVYPNDDLARSVSINRIRPMILSCPELKKHFREDASSILELQFDNMYIALCGANSAGDVSSRPIRYLFIDEVDKFPPATKKESDPVRLAKERVKTYPNHKIFMTSTPTVREGHIWRNMEAADALMAYLVPCPHCGAFIELRWDRISFPSAEGGRSPADRSELAVYLCQECDAIIYDKHKPEMLRQGHWEIAKRKAGHVTTLAYRLNTLYSPFVRWSRMAREFLLCQGDPEALQNFRNSWMGDVWEDLDTHTDADTVMERRTTLPMGTAPQWAEVLTAGVDVQKHSVYWTIRAWGAYLTSQNIAHGQSLCLEDAAHFLNATYLREDGQEMMVALCGIDSGDQTDMVYDFCVDNPEWTIPVKGAALQFEHYRPTTIDRPSSKAHGRRLLLVSGDKYKDLIAGRMKKENGAASGSWMVYQDCDMEYAKQVTAEHKVNLRKGGKTVQVWKTRVSHGDNHYLDCEVYAACIADVLGVRTLHLQDLRAEEQEPYLDQDQIGGGWLDDAGDYWE